MTAVVTPAQQLRSVAQRFRRRGASVRAPGRFLWWRKFGHRPGERVPTGDVVRDEQLARLEAVLFLAEIPLSSRKLAQFASLADGTRARTLVRRLNELYEQDGSAFRIEEVAGGFQLLTRPHYAAWLRRYQGSPVEARLSSPAMETLAIVAYRQPVMRAQLEAVRGVQSGEMLRQLLERDLVRIVGRSPELGRPFLYGTTKKFLQIFGLRDLQDLPRVEMLRSGQAGENDASRTVEVPEESDVKTAVMQESLEQDELREDAEVLALAEPVAPSADVDYEDEEFEDDDDDDWDDDDEDDDDYDDDYDEDFEDEDWEEVDDEHAFDEEDEDEEDWDDEDDDDWEDEDEEDDDEDEEEEEDEDWEDDD